NFNYTEANSWQYSFYVPQDISGFINLLGGKDKLEANLDKLFTAKDQTAGREQVDITGLIGQYAHGNEPSHHMAYLYNFVNKPHKTQERVYEILTGLYKNSPDGISGNEDCGQMSAWYIFSSMGFYPVTPASNQYIIGTPLFDKATINLENGKVFDIVVQDLSPDNKYIGTAYLNGEVLQRTFITHDEIINGGALEFHMTDQPSDWGTREGSEPITEISDHLIVPAPFIENGDVAFKGETEISLANSDNNATIFYKLDDQGFKKYEQPFVINKPSLLEVYSEKEGKESARITTKFYKIDPNLSIKLETDYANQYNAGGIDALIDGILGAKDFRTGTWQGYHDTDLIASIDLGSLKLVNLVSVNFLQDQRSWIFYPTEVQCFGSKNGKDFVPIPNESTKIDAVTPSETIDIKEVSFGPIGKEYRYIKIVAKTVGQLPEWHLGYEHDGRSWLFVDEIRIN
ncbi:MAG: glycoside hydrolase family 92 protein, partial [Flavobacteriaceae bacterium]|nr:glycoside hydrolase family 92 protein [Flavobacteriaceae bacterium]